MPPVPGQGMPRPFLLGVIMMLLVLSLQSDWNEPNGRNLASSAKEGQERILKEGVHEKIIYELSLDNERLESQVAQLKQYVLDVRRAARKCGCTADILNSDALLTLYPELHPDRNATNSTAQPGSSPEAAAAAAAAGGGPARGEAAAISAKLEGTGGPGGNATSTAAGGDRQGSGQHSGRRRLAGVDTAGEEAHRGAAGEGARQGPGWAAEGLTGGYQLRGPRR